MTNLLSRNTYLYCTSRIHDELQCIEINHPSFSALIALQGAQLLKFQPVNDTNWIWLSDKAEFKKGKSIRGGIPVCWPWFGNANDNPKAIKHMIRSDTAPAHGLVRTKEWKLHTIEESKEQIKLHFNIEVNTSELWQGNARLSLVITLQQHMLNLALTTTATDKSIAISQALHSYFPTRNIHKTRINGFENCQYYDALDHWKLKTQKDAITFEVETDRVYLTPASNTQILIIPDKTLSLESNTNSAVVWNPWIEKSKRLSQFKDDAWKNMFCLETSNAMDDFIQLGANESHTLELKLKEANLIE